MLVSGSLERRGQNMSERTLVLGSFILVLLCSIYFVMIS